MESLVVYESLYGNTKSVAEAIADGLRNWGSSRAVIVGAIERSDLEHVDLLVVGAPTHAWGLPRERTWTQAKPKPSSPTAGIRLRAWPDQLPSGVGRPAASFDTRMNRPRFVTGSAARGIARRLHHHGWARATAPASFLVTGTTGPLIAGELDRARAWGDALGRVAAPTRMSERTAERAI
jgi:Flavodoxin domain